MLFRPDQVVQVVRWTIEECRGNRTIVIYVQMPEEIPTPTRVVVTRTALYIMKLAAPEQSVSFCFDAPAGDVVWQWRGLQTMVERYQSMDRATVRVDKRSSKGHM